VFCLGLFQQQGVGTDSSCRPAGMYWLRPHEHNLGSCCVHTHIHTHRYIPLAQ